MYRVAATLSIITITAFIAIQGTIVLAGLTLGILTTLFTAIEELSPEKNYPPRMKKISGQDLPDEGLPQKTKLLVHAGKPSEVKIKTSPGLFWSILGAQGARDWKTKRLERNLETGLYEMVIKIHAGRRDFTLWFDPEEFHPIDSSLKIEKADEGMEPDLSITFISW